MSKRRTFPIHIARAYPGSTFCGHQHSDKETAANCASNMLNKPGAGHNVVQVVRIHKDGREKVVRELTP